MDARHVAETAEADLYEHQCKMVADASPVVVMTDDVVIGSWECEKSPIHVCAYDGADDPCHDSCLFCKYPEERK